MTAARYDTKDEPAWLTANRANWDERVAVHMGPRGYDLAGLRARRGRLNAIEEAELGPVAGLRVLHLQCHFGKDSLILAQRGAEVVGVDFSPAAIDAARTFAAELELAERARFVLSTVEDAPSAVGEPGAFDLVYVTWGAINWLPDIDAWARVVASFLKPGGSLYLAEGHPAALVLDDAAPGLSGLPGWYVPYFHDGPHVFDNPSDYADPQARLTNSRTIEWIHPLGRTVSAVIGAGLELRWLREHDAVTWRMFSCMVEGEDGLFRWPDRPWLPLSFSLRADRPAF